MCIVCSIENRAPGIYDCVDPADVGTPASISQTPGADTVAGSTATTETIATGSYERGFVNSSGDQDWYRITLTAGQTYTFRLDGFGENALPDAFLRVFNSAGVEINSDDDSGPLRNSSLTFVAGASGTFYISAGAFGTNVGQYILTANTGSTPFFPTVSTTDVADYIQYAYWGVNGVAPREWGAANTDITFNVTGLEPERAALARLAFATWADVCGLTFTETAGAAEITLDDNDESGAYANTTTSNGTIISATINIGTTWFDGSDAIDSYTFQTYIHEIGHTLGLGHGGPYNGSATYGVDNSYANDTWGMTIMSYMDQADASFGSYRFVMTPMMADIFAIQRMYGAATTRAGNTTYGHNANTGATGTGVLYNFDNYATAPSFTIYDSGGIDTLNASGYANDQTIDLRSGNFSNIGGLTRNIAISTTTVIENAIGGSGIDTMFGNSVSNNLYGRNGADVIDGREGNDHLYGGLGADQHIGGTGLDFARYDDANYGNLTIRLDNAALNVGAAAVGDTYNGIECLVGGLGNDTVVGDNLANRLYGQGGTDTIIGRNGNDILDGGDGTDHLYGGLGADQHIGGAGLDFARYDDANYGNLTIRLDNAALNVGAAAVGDTYNGIECLVGGLGNDTVVGDNLANRLYGQGGTDTIYGQAGNDILDGGAGNDFLNGGLGNDTLTGGANNDTFFFNTTLNAATNVDRITDFSVPNDTIRLENAIFTAIGPAGVLAAAAFTIGAAATTAAHRIVYNSATGALIYDSNGSAAGGATQFAILGTGLALTNADFLIT